MDCSSEGLVAVVGEVVIGVPFKGSVGSVRRLLRSDVTVDPDG